MFSGKININQIAIEKGVKKHEYRNPVAFPDLYFPGPWHPSASILSRLVVLLVLCHQLFRSPITGGRVGLVVRALAFHQCGPGSISALGVIRGLSLLVLYPTTRGFPSGYTGFPLSPKTSI